MISQLTKLACICLCALPVWLVLRRPWRRPAPREIALGLFMVFMVGVLVMALEGQWASPAAMLSSACERVRTGDHINLVPLLTIRNQLTGSDVSTALTQLLGNTLLFMPWGFFLPLLWRRFRGFLRMTGMSLALTLFIEGTQLFIRRMVDVDDLILNFAGSMCGAGLWWICHRIARRKDDPCGTPTAPTAGRS